MVSFKPFLLILSTSFMILVNCSPVPPEQMSSPQQSSNPTIGKSRTLQHLEANRSKIQERYKLPYEIAVNQYAGLKEESRKHKVIKDSPQSTNSEKVLASINHHRIKSIKGVSKANANEILFASGAPKVPKGVKSSSSLHGFSS